MTHLRFHFIVVDGAVLLFPLGLREIKEMFSNIVLDYFVYFPQIIYFYFLKLLVLSNIASFITRLKACANRA
jgi:hypothetical protein